MSEYNREPSSGIAAVVAAAGRSRRMGQPKQLLAWGQESVIGHIVRTLSEAGAAPVSVVVGHAADEVRACLRRLEADSDYNSDYNIDYNIVYNEAYAVTEMLASYQSGVRALAQTENVIGSLLALGDQPHIPASVIRSVLELATAHPNAICIPSYRKRRGHPFYLPRKLWPDLLALGDDDTLRDLLHRHTDSIMYIDVESPAILQDMDTPEAYRALSSLSGPCP